MPQTSEHVMSVFTQRQGTRPNDRVERQRPIEMREQRPAARRLPAQRRPQRVGLDGRQDEVAAPREPFGRGFRRLRGGGEMDVAVGPVDRRADKDARRLGRAPFLGADDLEDQGHRRVRPASPKLIGGGFPLPPSWGKAGMGGLAELTNKAVAPRLDGTARPPTPALTHKGGGSIGQGNRVNVP